MRYYFSFCLNEKQVGVHVRDEDEGRKVADRIFDLKDTSEMRWLIDQVVFATDEDDIFQVLVQGAFMHGNSVALSKWLEIFAVNFLDKNVDEVETWVTCPCPVPMISCPRTLVPGKLGMLDGSKFQASGLSVFPGACGSSKVREMSELVKNRIVQAEEAIRTNYPKIVIGEDAFTFKEVSSRGNHRFDLLLEDSELLQNFVRNGPWVKDLIDPFLGDTWNSQTSVVYSRPGAPDQEWHADGRHLGARPHFVCDPAPDPYAICVFVPLCDLSTEVGGTEFWPGSHVNDKVIGFGQTATVMGTSFDGSDMRAGDAVAYDYRLLHRGRANTSASTERCVIQILYKLRSYEETTNYGTRSIFDSETH